MTFSEAGVERLLTTEADVDTKFAQATSVLPKTGISEEALKTALTSQNWVILTGDKGSGKTSYLFLGLRELPRKRLGVYCPFETEGSNFEIIDNDSRNEFLCKHFYGGLISRLDQTIADQLPGKVKASRPILEAMVNSLIPVEIEQTRRVKKAKGVLARIGIRKEIVEVSASYGKSITDEIIERRQLKPRPDYEKFRHQLTNLIKELGYESVVFYIDEVNEIRLSSSEQKVLFDHFYNTYKTYKSTICFKVSITDLVEIPSSILAGNYFEPIDLKSFLLYPKEYEEFIEAILQARLRELNMNYRISQFFSDSAFHKIVMASMGNPRDFFLTARQIWQTKKSRADATLAEEKIRQNGGQREAAILRRGGDLQKIYYKIIDELKMRSTKKEGTSNSPTGVSYFLISNYETLPEETRTALDILEQSKILYFTGSYRALRRQGLKSEMMVIAFPICLLKSIRFMDVVESMKQLGKPEGQLISQHRAQLEL